MPLLPTVLLLMLGALVWLVRGRPERVVWAVSAAGQWVVWLSLLGIYRFVPAELSFSVWRPVELFRTPLVLRLDATGWTMAFVIATTLLAIAMTSAAREGSASPETRVYLSVYGALAMAAVVSGNLLTMAVLWAMMEIVAFSTSIILVGELDIVPREILRLAVQGTSVVLLLAAAILLGPNATSAAPASRAWGFGLGFVAAILRWGLFPAHYPLPALPGIRRGLGTCLRVLPFAMGMLLATRLIEAHPPAMILEWLGVVGGVLALIGGLAWAFHTDPVRRRPMLLMGVAGLTASAAALADPGVSAAMTLGGSACLVLLGGMISLAERHEVWHRWWVLAAGYMLLGGPLMPGQDLAAALVTRAPSGMIAAAGGLIGVILLALGVLRQSETELVPWASGEELVKLSYVVGIAILPLAGVGISIAWSVLPNIPSLGVFLALAGASALAFHAYLRAREAVRGWLERRVGSLSLPALPTGIPALAISPLRGLVWVGDLLQGDAGLLWILFFLLVLAAIVGAGS